MWSITLSSLFSLQRKPKSLGIRRFTLTVGIVYGVLALVVLIFNLPHSNLFARGLQSFLGLIVAEKLWTTLSQNSAFGSQLVSQELQWLSNIRISLF